MLYTLLVVFALVNIGYADKVEYISFDKYVYNTTAKYNEIVSTSWLNVGNSDIYFYAVLNVEQYPANQNAIILCKEQMGTQYFRIEMHPDGRVAVYGLGIPSMPGLTSNDPIPLNSPTLIELSRVGYNNGNVLSSTIKLTINGEVQVGEIRVTPIVLLDNDYEAWVIGARLHPSSFSKYDSFFLGSITEAKLSNQPLSTRLPAKDVITLRTTNVDNPPTSYSNSNSNSITEAYISFPSFFSGGAIVDSELWNQVATSNIYFSAIISLNKYPPYSSYTNLVIVSKELLPDMQARIQVNEDGRICVFGWGIEGYPSRTHPGCSPDNNPYERWCSPLTTSSPVPLREKTLLEFSRKGTTMTLSLNGNVEATYEQSPVFNLSDNTTAWRIGARSDGSCAFNGSISNIILAPSAGSPMSYFSSTENSLSEAFYSNSEIIFPSYYSGDMVSTPLWNDVGLSDIYYSAVIKVPQYPPYSSGSNGVLVNKEVAGIQYGRIQIHADGRIAVFGFGVGGYPSYYVPGCSPDNNKDGRYCSPLTTTNPVPLNTDTLVEFTRIGTMLSLYLNGRIESQYIQSPIFPVTNNFNWRIGSRLLLQGGYDSLFQGTIKGSRLIKLNSNSSTEYPATLRQ